MMVALTLAAVLPATAPATAEALTQPNIDFACKVTGADGQVRAMAFRLTGSRGYPTGSTPAYAATPALFTVVADDTGSFKTSDELSDRPGAFSGRWQGALWRFGEGRNLTQIRFFPSHREEAAIVVERQTPPLMSGMPDFPFAGICRTETTAQAPLDAAPKNKDRAQ